MAFLKYKAFGPGVLACATRGGGRSEAGHYVKICFPQDFGFFGTASVRSRSLDEPLVPGVFCRVFIIRKYKMNIECNKYIFSLHINTNQILLNVHLLLLKH